MWFDVERVPINLNWPLWKVKVERPEEWAELVETLENCGDEEFKEELNRYLVAVNNGDDRVDLSHDSALNETFAWLLGSALKRLPFDSDFVTLMRDLQDDYEPLKVKTVRRKPGREAPRHHEGDDDDDDDGDLEEAGGGLKVVQDLGTDLELEVLASGVPSPAYLWYFLKSGGDQLDWTSTEVTAPSLKIENFRLGDEGLYRCYVSHRMPVSSGKDRTTAAAAGSGRRGSVGCFNGTFSDTFEVAATEDSILVTKEPADAVKAWVGGRVELHCEAESKQPLKFQWFKDDIPLVTGNDLEGSATLLPLNEIWLDSAGSYHCAIRNGSRSVSSRKVELSVEVPPPSELGQKASFTNEDIRIILQPAFAKLPPDSGGDANCRVRVPVGTKVVLTCLAACKFPLRYEWLKRGVRRDVILQPEKVQLLPVEPVALGTQMVDQVQSNDVSSWIYRCSVSCPETGQKVMSDPVTVDVSATAATPEQSLPQFKVALVLCQEAYSHQDYFPSLRAPRNDGASLVKALKVLGFEVLAFADLTMDELRSSLDLFCSFVDASTYALVYYNGHALGAGQDIYLTARDTDLDRVTATSWSRFLLWQGELEAKLDAKRPLLCTVIYDACRDAAPEPVAEAIRLGSCWSRDLSESCNGGLVSNFCIGYGTRSNMRNYEKREPASAAAKYQGLYMKYLLRHLTTPGATVTEIFEKVYTSFSQEEDSSVASKMRPEFKSSTCRFSLDAPLRASACGAAYRRFFRACRFEASVSGPLGFEGLFCYDLGLRQSEDGKVHWMIGAAPGQRYDLVRVGIGQSIFSNEAVLTVSYQPQRSEVAWDRCGLAIQIIPCNVTMVRSAVQKGPGCLEEPAGTIFTACKKNPALGEEAFDDSDGPVFEVPSVSGEGPDQEKIGSCRLVDLQSANAPLKFRAILWHNGSKTMCVGADNKFGVMFFNLPIIANYPHLKLKSHLDL